MSTFYIKKGPYDINKIIQYSVFSEKKKFKKKLIYDVSPLKTSKSNNISFFENKKYIDDLKITKAGYVFLRKNDLKLVNNNKFIPIFSSNPLYDFIIIAKLFYPASDKDENYSSKNNSYKKIIKSNTFISKSAKLGKGCDVGFNTIIKKNVVIGKNVKVGSNCIISNSIIGDNVIIGDGNVIGKIGFGFKKINKQVFFIPHIGHVEIGANVYIGANCVIDRGSFSNTVIGDNTMIDNHVHIAHNVNIGSDCILAAQVGIAGSTKIGNNCVLGGQAGISGHLNIGDNVQIGGKSGVIRDVASCSKIMGYPAKSLRNFLKVLKND